jgi:hypothetical protein
MYWLSIVHIAWHSQRKISPHIIIWGFELCSRLAFTAKRLAFPVKRLAFPVKRLAFPVKRLAFPVKS